MRVSSVPIIGELGCQAERAGPVCSRSNQNGGTAGARAARAQHDVSHLIIQPPKVHRASAEKSVDDLQCFLESAHTMVEWIAERLEFRFIPAGAQAEDQAATADFVDGIGHLG